MNFNSLPLMKKFALGTIALTILSCLFWGVSALVIVAFAVLFMHIDKEFNIKITNSHLQQFSTNFINVYIHQLISIIVIIICTWLGVAFIWNYEILTITIMIGYGAVISYAYATYQMSQLLSIIAKSTNHDLFEYSAIIMKVCAFTIPFIFGGVFVLGAQLLFFLGYSTYNNKLI